MSLNEIYQEFQDHFQFIKIYIREAHPVDGWWFGKGFVKYPIRIFSPRVSLNTYDPKTIEERRSVAEDCADSLQYGVKTFVDEMDDQVNKDYAAWPTRIYMVDTQGIVVYAGGLGPFGFRPRELQQAIHNYLHEESKS